MSTTEHGVVLAFNGRDDGVGKTLDQAKKKAEEARVSVKGIGDAAKDIGGALTKGVTLPIVGIAAAATKTAVDYESAFAGVRKTVDATEEEFQRLYEATIAMSETKPVGAQEIMYIEELGGQLGIATENLLGFADTISDISAATNLGLEDAAMEFAQFANITGMQQDQFGRLGAMLVDLGNNAATTEADIMAMAMRIAGAGTSAGMSVQDIMALSTTLSSLGIQAEAGGTAISTIISNIDKAVATNGGTLSIWAEAAGQSAEEFAASWSDDPVVALQQVIEGMANMQDEGGNLSVLLEELGVSSIRQTDAFKRMANSGDLFFDTLVRSRTSWDEATALQDEVNNRYGTTESQLEILGNKLQNVAAVLGGPLAEALVDIIDAAEPLIEFIADAAQAFADMDEAEQRTIIAQAAFLAGLGPVTSGVGGLLQTVGKLFSFGGSAASGTVSAIEGIGTAAVRATGAGLSGGVVGLSVALAAVVGSVIIDGIVKLHTRMEELAEQAERSAKASEGVAGAVRRLGEADVSQVADGVGRMADSAGDLSERIKEATEGAISLFDSLARRNADTEGNIAQAEYYAGVIKELTSAERELTDGEQTRLNNAVDQYNQLTGASIEVVDALMGQISVTREELDAFTESYKQSARIQGYESALVDLYAEEAVAMANVEEAADALKQAQDRLAQAEAEHEAALADPWVMSAPGVYENYVNALHEAKAAEYEAAQAADEANKTLEGVQGSIELYTGLIDGQIASMAEAAAATDEAAESSKWYSVAAEEAAGSAGSIGAAAAEGAGEVLSVTDEMLQRVGEQSLQALRTSGTDAGSALDTSLAAAITEGSGQVTAASASLDDAARLQLFSHPWAYQSGLELGNRFADGIRDSLPAISSAVNAVAGEAANKLHFSEPKEGPLVGINKSGGEMVRNYAASMLSEVDTLEAAATRAARAASGIDAAPTKYESTSYGDSYALSIDGRMLNTDEGVRQAMYRLFYELKRVGEM